MGRCRDPRRQADARRGLGLQVHDGRLESGRPFNIEDASGNLVLRDRAAIRHTYLFDPQGDHVPGGIFLELLAERVSGPHPGFNLSEQEFCALVTPLLD